MPKPTFLNLPPDKRGRIVELAIEEFSSKPYRQASLSRIVARAGIAKGSIYQYFDNKLDLYRWLLTDELGRRKMAAIADAAPPAGTSIWHVLESAFVAGFRFAMAEPRLALLGTRFMRDVGDEPELRAIAAGNRAAAIAWMTGLIEAAKVAGDVRETLDVGVAAALLTQMMGEGMLEVLAHRLGVDLKTFTEDPSLAASLSADDVAGLVREVVGMLRGGLGAPTNEGASR